MKDPDLGQFVNLMIRKYNKICRRFQPKIVMSSYESEHKFLFHHISNESVLDFNSISRETNENVRIGHEQEFNPLQKK